MKKILFSIVALGLLIGACTPAAQPVAPTPLSDADLQATANALAQQTMAAIPPLETPTAPPTETAVMVTATNTEIPVTPTETQNPVLLTLTATLGAADLTASPTATLPATPVPNVVDTPTTRPTDSALSYGTVPNDYPRGSVTIVNKANDETYISMQTTLDNGDAWIDEYPLRKRDSMEVKEPAGRYHYVVWVGNTKMTGDFGLGNLHYITIYIYDKRVEVIGK